MNTAKKQASLPNVTGNHLMNWRELAEADDLASALTVDPFLGFTTHKMTEMKIRIPTRIKSKLRDIISDFQKNKCYETTFDQLTSDPNIVKKSLRSDVRFREHVYRYLLLFDDRSGVEIRPCWRYASENHVGAAIFATRNWPKGSRISTLIGCIAELKHSEETSFLKYHQNDFSVMYSSRKNCSQLWLGPAAYVNHDCQPNCEFTINCDIDARMSLEAKVDIKKGDEVFIYYGKHFFDTNNSACECFTCELLGRGYFSQNLEDDGRDRDNTKTDHSTSCPLETTPNKQNDPSRCSPGCRFPSDGRSSEEFERNFGRILRDRLNAPESLKTARLPCATDTPATLADLLRKGSSAGLARRSLSKAYSLRHTGSRLERVKARIFAEVVRTTEKDDGENKLKRRSKETDHKSVFAPDSKLRSADHYSSEHLTHCESRTSIWLRSAPTPPRTDSEADSSSSAFSVPPIRLSRRRTVDSTQAEFKVEARDPATTSVYAGEDANTVTNDSDSPLPPQLDRVSSVDSASMPSQLSTAASTPDLRISYYQCLSDRSASNPRMPILSAGTPRESPSSVPSLLNDSSGNTSCTSPACTVEPIMERLLDEARPSFTQRASNVGDSKISSTSHSKSHSKRLTNYDARLIAEASLLPPIPDKRQRRHYSLSFISTTNTLSKSSSVLTKLRHSFFTSPKYSRTHNLTASRLVRSRSFGGSRAKSWTGRHIRRRSKHPRNAASFTLSSHGAFKSCNSSADCGEISTSPPASWSTVSDAPVFCRTIVRTNPGSRVPRLTSDRFDIPGFVRSSCTTPLQTDPIDDLDESVDRSISEHSRDTQTPATSNDSMDYLYTEHNYTKPGNFSLSTPHHDTPETPTIYADRSPCSAHISSCHGSSYLNPQDFITSTPPPPVLKPATPISFVDRSAPLLLPNFCDESWFQRDLSQSPVLTSSSLTTESWPNIGQSDPRRSLNFVFSPISNPQRRLFPVSQRLTVTLKRIGPAHYQISRPNSLFVSN
ncbi:unnamed protein product [Calicophoron daubneyi]|uniref:[histone H4]-N-methyl-L-lysine(20) N-methyltransferase n=1 Tax=Calicophoron daubneyi TaxID=300641 RepID=A0AAV2TQ26_CALDB